MNLSVTGRNTTMQETVTQNKLAYSVEEISEITSLSKAFLRNEIRAERLKARLFGRRVLVTADALATYLQSKESWKPEKERIKN